MILITFRIKPQLLSNGLGGPITAVSKLLPTCKLWSTACFVKKVFWNTVMPFVHLTSLVTFSPQWQRLSSCDRDLKATPPPPKNKKQQKIYSLQNKVCQSLSFMICLESPSLCFCHTGWPSIHTAGQAYSHLGGLYLHHLPSTCLSHTSPRLLPHVGQVSLSAQT